MSDKPSLLETTKSLSNLENLDDLVEIHVGDFSCWPSIKHYLYKKFTKGVVKGYNNTRGDLFTTSGMLFLLWGMLRTISRPFNKKRYKKFVFTASSGLSVYDNQLLDTYSRDYITDSNVLMFINCNNIRDLSRYRDRLNRSNIIIENYSIGLIVNIISLFIYIKDLISIKLNFSRELKLAARQISSTCGTSVSEKEISRCLCRFKAEYLFYKTYFRFVFAESAQIVSSYSKSGICAALKSNGIRVEELQHGILGPTHHGYNYTEKLRKTKYRLPTPDQINVYNSFWKDVLLKVGYWKNDEVIITGRFKYEVVCNMPNDNELLNDDFIIFTGQSSFHDRIGVFIRELAARIQENKLFLKIYYRPHPKETAEEVESLGLSNLDERSYRVIDKSECFSTEQLIYKCRAHISLFSSCHFDAVYFKGVTYCLDAGIENSMEYFIENQKDNRFIKIRTAAEFVDHFCNSNYQ